MSAISPKGVCWTQAISLVMPRRRRDSSYSCRRGPSASSCMRRMASACPGKTGSAIAIDAISKPPFPHSAYGLYNYNHLSYPVPELPRGALKYSSTPFNRYRRGGGAILAYCARAAPSYLTSAVRLSAQSPRELLLGRGDLLVLDPPEQGLRPFHPVILR